MYANYDQDGRPLECFSRKSGGRWEANVAMSTRLESLSHQLESDQSISAAGASEKTGRDLLYGIENLRKRGDAEE